MILCPFSCKLQKTGGIYQCSFCDSRYRIHLGQHGQQGNHGEWWLAYCLGANDEMYKV